MRTRPCAEFDHRNPSHFLVSFWWYKKELGSEAETAFSKKKDSFSLGHLISEKVFLKHVYLIFKKPYKLQLAFITENVSEHCLTTGITKRCKPIKIVFHQIRSSSLVPPSQGAPRSGGGSAFTMVASCFDTTSSLASSAAPFTQGSL